MQSTASSSNEHANQPAANGRSSAFAEDDRQTSHAGPESDEYQDLAAGKPLHDGPDHRIAVEGDQTEPVQSAPFLSEGVDSGTGRQSGEAGPAAGHPRHSRLRKSRHVLRQRWRPARASAERGEQGDGEGGRRRPADRHRKLQARLRPERAARFTDRVRQRRRLEAFPRRAALSEPARTRRSSGSRRIDDRRRVVDREAAGKRDARNGRAARSIRLEHGLPSDPLPHGSRHRRHAAAHQQNCLGRSEHAAGRGYRQGACERARNAEAGRPSTLRATAGNQARGHCRRRSEILWRRSSGIAPARFVEGKARRVASSDRGNAAGSGVCKAA